MGVLAGLAVMLVACGGAGDGADAGGLDASGLDAASDGSAADVAPTVDAPPTPDAGGCVAATASAIGLDLLDDTEVRYRALLESSFEPPLELRVHAVRYGDVPDVGRFELGTGMQGNFASCSRCVLAWRRGATSLPPRAFLASEGAITFDVDPFSLTLRARLEGVVLREISIDGGSLESTWVEDGSCITLPDTSFDYRYVPPTWRCDAADYWDGTTCHCNCGAADPDCDDDSPIVGCGAGQTCVAGALCREACSLFPPTDGCLSGTCLIQQSGDYCSTDATLFDDARLFETCARETALHCAIEGALPGGICDRHSSRNDGTCRPLCDAPDDCDLAAGEVCFTLTVEGEGGGHGFCVPRSPLGWTCDANRYEDGGRCDCGCGVIDPDCVDLSLPIEGCALGERCEAPIEGTPVRCAPIPANDECSAPELLTLGTTVRGTTYGARGSLTTLGASCLAVDEQGPEVVYTLMLTAGDVIDVTVTPDDWNAGLYVLDPGAGDDLVAACDDVVGTCLAGNEVGEHGEVETLTFTAVRTGRHLLVVDSFFTGERGDFTLRAVRR